MNMNHVPLIGSSFDSLGAQRLQWSGFNNGVENANLARAAAAQQERNRYNFEVAKMYQEAEARDAAAQQQQQHEALSLALGSRASAEHNREFDISTGLQKQEIAARARQYQFPIDEKRRQEEEAKTGVQNFAEAMKEQAQELGSRHDSALQDYLDAQKELSDAASESEKSLIPGTWVKSKSGEFVPAKTIASLQTADPEKAKSALEAIANANDTLGKLANKVEKSQTLYDTHAAAFEDLKTRAGKTYGLEIVKKGGKYSIFNPLNNRTFTATTPDASEGIMKPAPQPEADATPSLFRLWQSNALPQQTYDISGANIGQPQAQMQQPQQPPPVAPVDPSQRGVGQLYTTPQRGPMIWTGSRWQEP